VEALVTQKRRHKKWHPYPDRLNRRGTGGFQPPTSPQLGSMKQDAVCGEVKIGEA